MAFTSAGHLVITLDGKFGFFVHFLPSFSFFPVVNFVFFLGMVFTLAGGLIGDLNHYKLSLVLLFFHIHFAGFITNPSDSDISIFHSF